VTDSREQVLQLVATGTITAADGAELLAALPRRRNWWRPLVDPMPHLGAIPIWLGVAIVVAGQLALSRLPARFDGAIDLHAFPMPPSFGSAVLDLAAVWLLPAGVLWATARVGARPCRPIDLVATVGFARLPLVALGLLVGLTPRLWLEPTTFASQMLTCLALVPGFILFLAWLVSGFRLATGMRGRQLVMRFVLAIALAEAASRLLMLANL
jgi:hypothetical protein